MYKKKSLITNFLYSSAFEVFKLIAPLITAPYISRVLGAQGIGIFSYTQSIATYFILIGEVGTTLYGQREIAYVQNDPQKRTEVFWQITIFRGMAVFLCTAVYYLIFGISGQYAPIYRILTIEVLATAFDISWFFMGMENFRLTMIRNMIIKIVGIILIFIFVKKPSDVPLYAVCIVLPIFIGNLSLWFSLPKYLVKLYAPAWKGIAAHIKPIFVLFLPQIAVRVYTVFDKTMIGLLSTGLDQVGFYIQAEKIIGIALTVVTALGSVMLSAMSAANAQGKTDEIKCLIKKSFKFIFLLAFTMIFGISAVAADFVPFFFGEGYDPVAPLMIVISPIILFIGMGNVLGRQFLVPTKQQKAYTISICIGACVNVVLNYLLIPRYNAFGASIATVFAELSVTTMMCIFVKNQLNLKECFAPMLRYALYGAVMFAAVKAVGLLLPGGVVSLFVQIAVGGVVYLAGLAITKDEMFMLALSLIPRTSTPLKKSL